MKLHLPFLLRKALLTFFAYSMGSIASAAGLTLGSEDSLTIDYADTNSIPDLADGKLCLNGDTILLLSNCGEGDGKTYTLFTGVSSLLDAEGNPLTLTGDNNAISNYFDTTQPGTGFWADGTLMITDGALQLVLHDKEVLESLTIITRQTSNLVYNYYEGISFKDIYSSSSGGAIYGGNFSTIMLSNNGSVSFSGNSASCSSSFARGGAICGDGAITLSNNGSVTFIENYSAYSGSLDGSFAFGGAIYGTDVEIKNNAHVEFSNNAALSYKSPDAYGVMPVEIFEVGAGSWGGAIYADTELQIKGNNDVSFSGNTADSHGGAIRATLVEVTSNDKVLFSNNVVTGMYAGFYSPGGGAIWCDGAVKLNNNAYVKFSENRVLSRFTLGIGAEIGAALAADILEIRNNGSVIFEKNVVVHNGNYLLSSFATISNSSTLISLSVAKGNSIEFRDSIAVHGRTLSDHPGTMSLNADYTDAAGVTHKQQGDIIFTGQFAETHLNELLAADGVARSATAEEILRSRTTEVGCVVNLYNGRLIIKEDAIWAGWGITVEPMEKVIDRPTLLLQNGILAHTHGVNVVTIKSGGTFEVSGQSCARHTSLIFESGSNWTLNVGSMNDAVAVLALESDSTLSTEGSFTMTLKGDASLDKGNSYKLLSGVEKPDSWNEERVTVASASDGWDVSFDDLTWEDDTLWLYYDGAIEEIPAPEPDFRPSLSGNQQEVYETIKDIMTDGNPGGLLGELGKEVADSRDENELKSLLDAMGGAEYTTMMSSQIEGNLGHIRRLRAAAGTGQSQVPQYGLGFYINAFNSDTDVDSDAAGPGYTRTEWGAHFGVEGRPAEHLTVGLGLEKSRARVVPSQAARYHEDAVRVDAYAAYEEDGWRVLGAVGMGSHDYDLKRTLPNGSVAEAEDLSGSAVNLMAEVSYTMQLAEAHVLQPYFVAESSINKIDGFSETGAGNASLQGESRDAWATELTLGLRYLYRFAAVSGAPAATLSLHSGVVADIGDTTDDLTLRFAGSERSFTQRGADRNRWGYSAGVGVTVPVDNKVSVYGQAESILRGDTAQVDAQVGVRVVF